MKTGIACKFLLPLSLFCFTISSCSDSTSTPNVSTIAPKVLGDGWEVSSPEAEGINLEKLLEAYHSANRSGFVYSLLIAKNGKLVSEQYFGGRNENTPFDVRSVTKSIVSLLIGIAVDRNHISDINQKVADIMPEIFSDNISGLHEEITIQQLLTMSSGITDNTTENLFQNQVMNIINSTLVFDPGAQYLYTSRGVHILTALLEKVSGTNSLDFANQFLFGPMGEEVDDWATDNQGVYFGGTGIFITARKMAKIGQLMQDNGVYKGTQVVPADWIERSISNVWPLSVSTDYGYLWWIQHISGHTVIAAQGFAGQLIFDFTELNMVVVITSRTSVDNTFGTTQFNFAINLIVNEILTAATVGSK